MTVIAVTETGEAQRRAPMMQYLSVHDLVWINATITGTVNSMPGRTPRGGSRFPSTVTDTITERRTGCELGWHCR